MSEVCQHKALRRQCPQCELLEEIGKLQRALSFWMPYVPVDDDEIAKRAGDDAYLLIGWNGPSERSAQDMGWYKLRESP